MKTLIQFFSPIVKYSIWKDVQGKLVCIEETSWFENFSFFPVVVFYYLSSDNTNGLMCVDRYTFCKYMTKQ